MPAVGSGHQLPPDRQSGGHTGLGSAVAELPQEASSEVWLLELFQALEPLCTHL